MDTPKLRTPRPPRSASVRPLAAILFILLTSGATLLRAGQIRSVSLDDMAHRADRIFSGRCIAAHTEQDPALGISITRVTFEVERAVKGTLGRTVSVKMVGSGGGTGTGSTEGFEAPRFAPGERVVLFLYADSALGLTSPVGLGQGKFSIVRDKQGRERAINAYGNKNLRDEIAPQAQEHARGVLSQPEDPIELSPAALLDRTRELLAREKAR